MNKMIEIKWGGRGKRILCLAEGYSQTYTWDGHGAVVEVKQEDALRVLTEPRAQFTCVNPADLASLEAEGAEPPQATAQGRIVLKVAAVTADTEFSEQPQAASALTLEALLGNAETLSVVDEQPHLPPPSTGPPPKHPVAGRRGAKRKKPKASAGA